MAGSRLIRIIRCKKTEQFDASRQRLFKVRARNPAHNAPQSIRLPALFSCANETNGAVVTFDWRAIFGPALTAATALIALAADRLLSSAPNPAPLFVCIVALAGSLSGLRSSLISAALALVSSALFFSARGVPIGASASDLTRLSMLAGLLRKRLVDTLAWERRHHATAERLSAALDQFDIGIVLLDSDTRAEFINRAFRDYFALPDEKADSKPPFIALMYHGRDIGAWEMPEEELSAFIAERTEMMRSGDSTPVNINLRDGQVLRFSCTALPDGGRMLSYTPVTDLVRHTDDPASSEFYRSLRDGGGRGLARHLRAAE